MKDININIFDENGRILLYIPIKHNYIDIIKNSDEIYIIDSCFTGILLPFIKTNKLKTKNVHIFLRSDNINYPFSYI